MDEPCLHLTLKFNTPERLFRAVARGLEGARATLVAVLRRQAQETVLEALDGILASEYAPDTPVVSHTPPPVVETGARAAEPEECLACQ